MKNELWKIWKKRRSTTVQRLVLGLMWVVSAVIIVQSGVHNNDLCRNEVKIENDINNYMAAKGVKVHFQISETNAQGHKIGLDKCHAWSLVIIQIGSLSLGAAACYFGYWVRRVA